MLKTCIEFVANLLLTRKGTLTYVYVNDLYISNGAYGLRICHIIIMTMIITVVGKL